MKKRIPCGQCKHGGTQWRVDRKTSLHCQHPDLDISCGHGQHEDGMPLSGWANVREWYQTCKQAERKP